MINAGLINPMRNNESSDQFTASIRWLRIVVTLLQIWSKANSRICWYSVAADLIMERRDMAKIINSLGVVVPIACAWSKWISVFKNEATIKKLLNYIKINWTELGKTDSLSRSQPNSKQIMKTYSRTATTIFLYSYLALTIFSVEFFVADSQVRRNSDGTNIDNDNLLVLPISWYPLNYKRSSKIQFLIVMAESITSLTTVSANASMDGFFVAVTLHLCDRFKISNYAERITHVLLDFEFCDIQVRPMAKRHQTLFRIADSRQKSYNFVLLEPKYIFLAACCSEFLIHESSIKTVKRTVNILKHYFQSLTDNLGITLFVYDTQRYNSQRSTNISFLLIMIRSIISIEINASKLFLPTLENFTILIKAVASYIFISQAIGVSDC